MKVWDSIESLVDSLVVSLSAGHVVMAAKAHHGIASDNSGCGVNYYDRIGRYTACQGLEGCGGADRRNPQGRTNMTGHTPSGSTVNFPIYGIWNATQLILATGKQNWIFPVAWSICQKKMDRLSSLPTPPGGPPGACNVFTLGPLNSGGSNEPFSPQTSVGVAGATKS
jgi:hypothetical protein